MYGFIVMVSSMMIDQLLLIHVKLNIVASVIWGFEGWHGTVFNWRSRGVGSFIYYC